MHEMCFAGDLLLLNLYILPTEIDQSYDIS